LPGFEKMGKLSFSEYLKMYLFSKDVPYGCYLDYTEYMWSLRDDPNTLVMYFEDMILVNYYIHQLCLSHVLIDFID